MIDWFRDLFTSSPPEPSDAPNIDAFVARQRASRAGAIDQRRASERVTRELRTHPSSMIAGMVDDVERHWRRSGTAERSGHAPD